MSVSFSLREFILINSHLLKKVLGEVFIIDVPKSQSWGNDHKVPHSRNIGCLDSIIGNQPIAIGEFLDSFGEVNSEYVLRIVHNVCAWVFWDRCVQSCLSQKGLDPTDRTSCHCHSHDGFRDGVERREK